MDRDHKLRVRFGRFVERGMRYAAQAVAGREAGLWPFTDARLDAAISRTTASTGAGVTVTASRLTVAQVPGQTWLTLGQKQGRNR